MSLLQSKDLSDQEAIFSLFFGGNSWQNPANSGKSWQNDGRKSGFMATDLLKSGQTLGILSRDDSRDLGLKLSRLFHKYGPEILRTLLSPFGERVARSDKGEASNLAAKSVFHLCPSVARLSP